MLKYITVSWLIVVFWMMLVFSLSSQIAEDSNVVSSGVTEMIIKVLERAMPDAEINIKNINHIIRKNAHFFIYSILSISILDALQRSGVKSFNSAILTLILCVVYAISDEIHQLYVPGRGGTVKDILIDSLGASVGVIVYLTFKMGFNSRKNLDD